MQGICIHDLAIAVACIDIGVRAPPDLCFGFFGADAAQQFEVGCQPAAAGQHRHVVFHLSGYQNDPSFARPDDLRGHSLRCSRIFADARVHDRLPQQARTLDQVVREFLILQNRLEIARMAGVEMDTTPVHNHGRWRHQIAAKANRSHEAILDAHDRYPSLFCICEEGF